MTTKQWESEGLKDAFDRKLVRKWVAEYCLQKRLKIPINSLKKGIS
jgi:hypothetical protein